MTTHILAHQAEMPDKGVRARSNWTMAILILIYGLIAAVSVLFSGEMNTGMPAAPQMPAPTWVMALANGGIVLVGYGFLAALAMVLSRRIGLPEIWESRVTNRQRFLTPLVVGLAVGMILIALDVFFNRFNTLGTLPHPAFPLSILASLAAGIGEELVFRFFFISLWTWLVAKILLRGKYGDAVYWIFAVISALAFSATHFPAVLYLYNLKSIAEIPAMMIAQIFLLNTLISLPAAWLMKRYGYLAAAGTHFWADIVWHVVWGVVAG